MSWSILGPSTRENQEKERTLGWLYLPRVKLTAYQRCSGLLGSMHPSHSVSRPACLCDYAPNQAQYEHMSTAISISRIPTFPRQLNFHWSDRSTLEILGKLANALVFVRSLVQGSPVLRGPVPTGFGSSRDGNRWSWTNPGSGAFSPWLMQNERTFRSSPSTPISTNSAH